MGCEKQNESEPSDDASKGIRLPQNYTRRVSVGQEQRRNWKCILLAGRRKGGWSTQSGNCAELGNLERHANRKGASREKVRPKVEMGVQGADLPVVAKKLL